MKHTFDINAEFFVDYDFNENLYFEPYYAIIDDDYVEEMVPSEIELYKYYKSASKNLEYGESYRYTNKGKTIYFMPLERVIVDDTYFENDDPNNILIYVNISPVASIVSTINKIFAVVFFLIIVFVVWIGKKTDKYLEMSDKNLKSFFSNASHELKTPIMSIQSYAEGIEKEIVDEKEAAQIIIKESERMSNLVGDILEISKIDSGSTKLNAYYSDLREVSSDELGKLGLRPINLCDLKEKNIEATKCTADTINICEFSFGYKKKCCHFSFNRILISYKPNFKKNI